jgi:hypothetical protein
VGKIACRVLTQWKQIDGDLAHADAVASQTGLAAKTAAWANARQTSHQIDVSASVFAHPTKAALIRQRQDLVALEVGEEIIRCRQRVVARRRERLL